MSRGGRVEPTPPECALAVQMFDHFCSAGTMKQILALHREICNILNLKPNRLPDFYPKLKAKLASSWKAQALFKKFDARANHKVYVKGRACAQNKILIIGAGPCGLRAAIECQLLGAKVVVIEKRDRISRNNVLHLWPFVIQDLKALGAKKFFGKFCAGSIDHISIRQLQCILLKVSLLLGVEFYEGVGFEELLEPTVADNSEVLGWRARVTPADHPVSQYEFDALVGADGKRNTLQGFKRTEFRGKLAMAITANFINRHTEQEASVPEISGVAFIFNQKFFKDLYAETGIDLENIVYYKDETHYFVMTAKKHSLLDKGVILNDYTDVSRLLSVENVDRSALLRYAQEAARFSTDGRLPLRDFALNHYGEPDVALFDFTSMYAAENASMVYERLGRRVLCQLVGDSLLEPFWPTGSGCARGFLSAMDAGWAIRSWGLNPSPHPLKVISERESIYRLLAQTTPENLQRDFGAYTLDPCTRYPNLNRATVAPHRVTSFYNSDDPLPLDAVSLAKKRRRDADVPEEALLAWAGCEEGGVRAAISQQMLCDLVRRYRPDLLPPTTSPRHVYSILHHEFAIPPFSSNGSTRDIPESKLRSYLTRVYHAFKGEIPHVDHPSPFDQIKENDQTDKFVQMSTEKLIDLYTTPEDTDRSHSSYKKKRRSLMVLLVSNDPAECIRKKIGKLNLNEITQLARLIEGQDVKEAQNDVQHIDKQKELQKQIMALLDSDDSTDPNIVRDSLAQLLEGSSKVKVKTDPMQSQVARFFNNENCQHHSLKQQRRLKGLDINSMKVPDLSDIFADDFSTKTHDKEVITKTKEFIRSSSVESPLPPKIRSRRLSDGAIYNSNLCLQSSSEHIIPSGRSNSIGSSEISLNTKQFAQIFEGNKRRHIPSPDEQLIPSRSFNTPEMALRLQRMTELIESKRRDTPSPDRTKRIELIGNPEIALRRQRVAELIDGNKPRSSPERFYKSSNSDMTFRMQRVSDMIQKKSAEAKRPKSGGRRKAAREITRQRFEKSLQMLATEPRMDFPSTDLENDYGLQQYRANAPQFGERVKKLEKKLQHYEEGKAVGSGSKGSGGGARVARIAAKLSDTTTTQSSPRASKPKDLMRSVGKIERDDWNVKEIERKIMENRLGRPEPKTAEKVPKWDREQFLGRQRRLKEGDGTKKYGEIDQTLHKLEQKLHDTGRPNQGTKKVANLAKKFVKKNDPEPSKSQAREKIQSKKSWRGPASMGMQCAACGTRVFAAEGVTADGLHLHRACFRCAVCKAVLRPGNYTMERYGSRLVCLRHSGTSVPDAVTAADRVLEENKSTSLTSRTLEGLHTLLSPPTPERISLEISDNTAREIDEDEWTDRNFPASETSCVGGLSDEDESSSDEYTDAADSENEEEQSPEPQGVAEPRPTQCHLFFSDDSFGYDDYSDDGAESSGNESCSRMREAREARRREVPADARPPTDSSEVESEEESESSDEQSSATEVSTDSEFTREESILPPTPPAILVTEAPHSVPPPLLEYPLSRTRSAGGLATKRALELKRKYLLGETSPPTVRKSDSTSQLDTKLEAFRTNITEFQKMLHPASAPTNNIQPQRPIVSFQLSCEDNRTKPMPDIIKNLCDDAPVDLLTKSNFLLSKKDWNKECVNEEQREPEVESDSLSEDISSCMEVTPNQSVPRVEVHDEGGELIQLDSLMITNSTAEETDDKALGTATATIPTIVNVESESSESCRDPTTLALTETDISDWAAEGLISEECGFEEKDENKRSKDPRTLSAPKTVHDAKNISAIISHVCGRISPTEPIAYFNALEHFKYADEGEQDVSIVSPELMRNEGYMELVEEEYDPYSLSKDRSINVVEGKFSETVLKSTDTDTTEHNEFYDNMVIDNIVEKEPVSNEMQTEESEASLCFSNTLGNMSSDNTVERNLSCNSENIKDEFPIRGALQKIDIKPKMRTTEIIDLTNSSFEENSTEIIDLTSPCFEENRTVIDLTNSPLASRTTNSLIYSTFNNSNSKIQLPTQNSIRLYSPAICRSASENFNRSTSRNTDSTVKSLELSVSLNLSSGSVSPVSPTPLRDTTDKVNEIKRERAEQTELVRRLVLERLGSAPRVGKKLSRRMRISPVSNVPPPVPPPPALPGPLLPPEIPTTPPRPVSPFIPLAVTPSFSDPELARERRRKNIMRSISNYLNRRLLGPRHKWVSSPDLMSHESPSSSENKISDTHKSTGALQTPPPVPPPPARYCPPTDPHSSTARMTAEQQAATVAELVQVSAQHEAHQALMAADRRRNAAGGSVGG